MRWADAIIGRHKLTTINCACYLMILVQDVSFGHVYVKLGAYNKFKCTNCGHFIIRDRNGTLHLSISTYIQVSRI
ncbi:hypothetical protein DSM107003_19060 [Trichormus variabilis SAG 1403-4b]|uniref:Uncharacterized protein n=1 Tax=Trichormus variabilis SAG 1403-4b TaxID=447716 RepID=A0A3S1AB72_ANAVA|nr:hypothetical protein DSM107003_19060 [Trichormus variabilis SAG 1403-4b]